MTTLVYRDGILAADSRITRCDWAIPGTTFKIARMQGGTLLGVTGDCAAGAAWIDWYVKTGGDGEFDIGEDTTGVAFHRGGWCEVFQGKHRHEIVDAPFHAFGSGFPVALGALHMGADARRAVEIAAMVDPGTGGPVDTLAHDEA